MLKHLTITAKRPRGLRPALIGALLASAVASNAFAGSFFDNLIPGFVNTFEDQGRESIIDLDGSNSLSVGDVLIGFLRLDNRAVPASLNFPLGQEVYFVFSNEVESITSASEDGSTTYDITFKPTTVAGLTLSELLGVTVPDNSMGALYEDIGIDLINTAPVDSDGDNVLTMLDFVARIAASGTPGIIGVRDLSAGDHQTSFSFLPTAADPFANLQLLKGATQGAGLPGLSGFHAALSLSDGPVNIEFLPEVPDRGEGLPKTLHQAVLSNGTVSGAADLLYDADPPVEPGPYGPFFFCSEDVECSLGDDVEAFGLSFNLDVSVKPDTDKPVIIIEKTPDADDEDAPIYGPGETASFTIKVTNLGPGSATNVVITDALPTANFGDWSVFSELPDLGVCTIDGSQILSCPIGDLNEVGGMFTVQVKAVVSATATIASVVAPSTFNASDGNLLLDNTEIPADVRAANNIPENDTVEGYTDWETFKDEILGNKQTPGITADLVDDLPSGQNDNSYTQGTKNDSTTAVIADGSIPPNKDDLLRWYFVQEEIGTDVVLNLGWVRDNRLGSAHVDFELNQQADYPTDPDPFFGDWIRNRTEGDVLITFDFTGSKRPDLGLSRWLTDNGTNTAADCEANNSLPCWGEIQVLGSSIADGAVNFDDSGTQKPGDDTFDVVDPIVGTTIEPLRFGEASINFTATVGSTDECTVFTQAHVNSRSSDSFNAALKDLIAPVPVELNNCVTVPNTAFATAENAAGVSDDGSFFIFGD